MKREGYTHVKFKQAARDLGIPLCYLHGIIGDIWMETTLHFPAGDIGRYSNEQIAIAIDYPDDPDVLINTLIKHKLLDAIPEEKGRLYIHDWHEHCDDAVHMGLARKVAFFANGAVPKLNRLNQKTQDDLKKEYALKGATFCTTPAHHITDDAYVRTEEAYARTATPPHAPPSHAPPEPEEGERASAPPPPPSDSICAYLDAERLFHASFANELFRFHGATPQGDLKTAYVEMLADWISHGIQPTPEQLKAAVDDAIAFWRREGKKGSCTGFGPVKKALTEIINVPLIATRTQTLPDLYAGQPKTPEEHRARRRAENAKLARLMGAPV